VRYLKYIFTFAPVILIILLVYLTPRLIKINTLTCRSQYGPCSQTFSDKTDSFRGKSISEVKKGLGGYFQSSPFIKEYSFTFRIPDRLIINIIEAKAKFSIGNKASGVYCPVDKDGVCLRIESSTNLPLLEISSNPPNVGEKVDSGQLFALEIISSLYSSYSVKEGKLVEGRLEVELPDGYTAIFPLEGDREVLLGSLEIILSRLKSSAKDSKIDYTTVSKIDLRFKNPVLK
jgi:hypothetical protein